MPSLRASLHNAGVFLPGKVLCLSRITLRDPEQHRVEETERTRQEKARAPAPDGDGRRYDRHADDI